jgi:hypothetical protein
LAAPAALARLRRLTTSTGKDLRIVLCGYEREHDMPGWRTIEWQGARGYAGADNDNRSKERLWLSPHCLESGQVEMFS